MNRADAPDRRRSNTGRGAPPCRPDGTPARVLVVDDEASLTEAITSVLHSEGWATQGAVTGRSAIRVAAEFNPDAVVLDIMLPDVDGFEVLQSLRSRNPQVCVLFLTARDEVEDRILGLRAGADDYVTKPFSLDEILVRLQGLLRRAGLARSLITNALTVADLVLDEEANEVRRGPTTVDLTVTEFKLLRLLMRHARQVLTKAFILEQVWQYDFGGQSHIVELYISYLRKKIDDGRSPLIHTVRGVGYVLKPPPE